MEIQLLGTGAILTSSLSSCAIIDKTLLMDCPNGSVKAMRRRSVNPHEIKICLITHYHGDHYFDLPFLILEHKRFKTPLTIVGPIGLENKLQKLFELAFPNEWELIDGALLHYVEIKDKMQIQLLDYTVKSYRVQHGPIESFGYCIQKGTKGIGFTGDTSMCEGVHDILRESDIAFVDMCFVKRTMEHMCVEDIKELIEQYPSTKIIPTHMTDDAKELFSREVYAPPNDGDTFKS